MEDKIRERMQAGRFEQAFELLVEHFKDKVFRLAFSFLRDESHAEDTAQEVFLKIWKGLPTYQGKARLSTWIYTITRNTCLTEIKRRNARPTVSFLAERSNYPSRPKNHLLKGLMGLLVGIALYVAIGAIGSKWAVIGLIPVAMGLAHLIYYFVAGRKEAGAPNNPVPPQPQKQQPK